MWRPGAAVLALALSAALGCTKPYYAGPGAPRASELQTFLLLPVNYEVVPPNSWVDGIERVQSLVRAHLEANGHDVRGRSLSAVLETWTSAVRKTGGLEDPQGEIDLARYRAARARARAARAR
jgi:hypothetical protein